MTIFKRKIEITKTLEGRHVLQELLTLLRRLPAPRGTLAQPARGSVWGYE